MTIQFKHTMQEDLSAPDANYEPETQEIEVGEGYTFSDWLNDHDVRHEEENGTYYVLVDDLNSEERTGEAYMLI